MTFWLIRHWLIGSLLVLLAFTAQAQACLNLGLEPGANHGHPLALWARGRTPGVRVQLDSTVFRQGRGSLRLELAEEDERLFTYVYSAALPPDSLRGQLVTVSAWVRTRGFRGRAGIYAFAHAATSEGPGADQVAAVDSLPADLDWRRIELRLPVKATAQGFGLGVQAWGNGQVWFDDLQVRVGGRRVGAAPVAGTEALFLTPAEALTPNWDFERALPRAAGPDPARATVALDSAQPQHGRQYLRLARVGATGPAPAAYLGTLKLEPELVGKLLQVSGYWRQPRPSPDTPAGEAPSFAYTLLSTDQGSGYYNNSPTGWGSAGLQTAPPLPAPGPEWTAFTFALPVPSDYARLAALALSVRLPGPGPVELDNLRFALNGAPYAPAAPPTPPAPTAAEITWLRTALKPLRLDAPATDFLDLAPLGSLVGAARLVGVGEVMHGSHELAELRHRLLRYLVNQKGFTGLVLDASPAPCAALNDYLQTGQGDPARLLAALEGWHSAEMLDLVRWLRAYNQAHSGGRVFVAGADGQRPDWALAQFGQTLEAADDFAQSRLRQLRQLVAAPARPGKAPDLRRHPDQPQDSLVTQVRRLTAELAAGLDTRAKLRRGTPPSLRALARQRYYLRLVEQGTTLRRLPLDQAAAYRAACLAENVQHLSEQAGPAKLVVWAHNTLVATSNGSEHSMGQWLRATHGAGYVALGLALGQGRAAAENSSGQLTALPLVAAPLGSYEAWLRTGPPAFLLSLGKLELTEANAWLFQQQLLRDAGQRGARHQFRLHDLRGEFDAVVFVRDSTPARFLP